MTGFQRCMLIAIPCSLVLWIIILTIGAYIISLL